MTENSPAPSSPSQPFPNLGDVITSDDVSQKGTGKYTADYVNWCRVAHLLQDNAPGWQFHLAHYVDSSHVWKAPNGTGYVVGYFTGPNGERTPDFPQAVMDFKNNPVPYEKITARDVTDTHRRGLAACAAFTFGLAWQLWAREEVEDPMRPQESKPATKTKPAAAPAVAGVSKEDQPLSDDERNFLLKWITDMPAPNREAFCEAFRSQFGLKSNAKVAPAISSKKHEAWIQAVMNEYA